MLEEINDQIILVKNFSVHDLFYLINLFQFLNLQKKIFLVSISYIYKMSNL